MSPLCVVCGTTIRHRLPAQQCSRCLLELARVGSKIASPPLSGSLLTQGGLLNPSQVRHFGDFELLHEIARGGMGVVYRAQQISLGRPVAVKMILAGQLATPDLVERFRLEAQAAAKMDHPRIVPIYEVGEHETQHYFAMKLVEGGSLGDSMSRFCLRSLDVGELKLIRQRERDIASLLLKIADALAYAHARGILHRDVKPNNILLERGDEPLLTDFGLAKASTESGSLTHSGVVLGSPSYMAPEQAAGGTKAITTAVDVYGLGAVLYEMLTGRPPFVGVDAVATLRRLQDEEVEPVERLTPAAHSDLVTICHRCLEKDPVARYPSVLAVAEELESFLQGKPIRARPISSAERFRRWCSRRPAIAALGGTVIITACLALTAVLWQWRRAEAANTGLVRSLRHSERQRTEQLVEANEAPRAVALLAARLRQDPEDTGAAMLAMSVLEQRNFGLAVSSSVSHGNGVSLNRVQVHANGEDVVTAGNDGRAWLWTIKRIGEASEVPSDAITSQVSGSPCFEFRTNRPPLEHAAPVRWVEFCHDPKHDLVATASDDHTARVWRVADAMPLCPPLRHDGPVRMVVFEPGDRRVATASADGTVRLWDAMTGAAAAAPLPQDGPVSSVAFSHDGRWLAAGYSGGAKIWEVQHLQSGARFIMPVRGTVNALHFDPADRQLLTVAHEGAGVNIWNLTDGRLAFACPTHGDRSWSSEYSIDGSRVVTCSGRWGRLWDTTSGRQIGAELPHYYAVLNARFTPDGGRLATFSWDSMVRFWDSAAGQPSGEPLLHTHPVLEGEFSSSGDRLVTLSGPWDSTRRFGTTQMRLWDLRARGARPLRFSSGAFLSALSFSSDGSRVAAADFRGRLWILDASTAKLLVGPLTNGTTYLRGLAWTPDGHRVVASSMDGTVRVWDAESGLCRVGPAQVLSTTLTTSLSRNGSRLMVGGQGGHVALWDTQSAQIRPLSSQHRGDVNGTDVSPDGRLAASGAEDGTVGIYDVASAERLHFIHAHDDEVLSVQFSPDSQRLLTASHDTTARLWDVRNGTSVGSAMHHEAQVVVGMWSPDGRRIVTAARDGTARIWDARTGTPLYEPLRHRSALRGASFSPDSRRVVTEDHIGLRVWDVETGDPLTLTLPHSTMTGIGFNSQGLQVTFSPDGQRIAHATGSADVVIYEVPVPQSSVPAWFPELLEAVIGAALSSEGVTEKVEPSALVKVQSKLSQVGADDFYGRWARWYLEVDPNRPRYSAWGNQR
jgi:WD40 repeat protein